MLAPSGHIRNCSLLRSHWWLHFSSVIHGGTQSSYHKNRVKRCIYCGILMCKSFTSKLCHRDISFLCWTPTHSVRKNFHACLCQALCNTRVRGCMFPVSEEQSSYFLWGCLKPFCTNIFIGPKADFYHKNLQPASHCVSPAGG